MTHKQFWFLTFRLMLAEIVRLTWDKIEVLGAWVEKHNPLDTLPLLFNRYGYEGTHRPNSSEDMYLASNRQYVRRAIRRA